MKNNHNDIYCFIYNRYYCTSHQNFCELRKNDESNYEMFGIDLGRSIYSGDRWNVISHSNKEEDYVENYAKPLCSVRHKRFTVVVGFKDGKTYIKLFEYIRKRDVGQKYFKISTAVQYISYNNITNSLFVGKIVNYHKKRKFSKNVRKNSFSEEPLGRLKSLINSHLSEMGKEDSEILFKKNEIVNKVIDTFIENIPGTENYKHLEPDQQLYKLHLDKWGVKLPNNWTAFSFSYPQPKKKDFLKHKMKYIDTIMTLHNLKGDKVKKTLHQIEKFSDSTGFNWVCNFFGKDFILSKDSNILKQIFESVFFLSSQCNSDFLSKKEKENAFMIYQLCLLGEIDFTTFYDHISMISRLKKFEDFKWYADTYNTFNEEHYTLSEKLGYYTKGDFKRIYNQKFINETQKPIVLEEVYYPVILTTSKEYNMESFVQSNCVKGYVNKPDSLIISLRRGSEDSKDRVTIEFKIQSIKNNIVLRRVQTLGRFNKRLTPEWNDSINSLDFNIEKIVENNLFKLPSVELKLGYKIIESQSKFKENTFISDFLDVEDKFNLVWENTEIENIQSINNHQHERNYLPYDIL